MGCWNSDGHGKEKTRLLTLSMHIYYFMERLIEFCDEKRVDQKKFERAMRSAVELLRVLGADYIPKFRNTSLFSWKDENGNSHIIHYEHLDVFGRVADGLPNPGKTIMEMRRKLFSLVGRRLDKKSKKKNAKECIDFFYKLNGRYLYEFNWYEPRAPKGIRKLLTEKPKGKKLKRSTKICQRS